MCPQNPFVSCKTEPCLFRLMDFAWGIFLAQSEIYSLAVPVCPEALQYPTDSPGNSCFSKSQPGPLWEMCVSLDLQCSMLLLATCHSYKTQVENSMGVLSHFINIKGNWTMCPYFIEINHIAYFMEEGHCLIEVHSYFNYIVATKVTIFKVSKSIWLLATDTILMEKFLENLIPQKLADSASSPNFLSFVWQLQYSTLQQCIL